MSNPKVTAEHILECAQALVEQMALPMDEAECAEYCQKFHDRLTRTGRFTPKTREQIQAWCFESMLAAISGGEKDV